jgi:hypothetical protein
MRPYMLLAMLAMTTTAHAASIVVLPLGQNKPSLVVITGTIDLADKDEFLRKIAPLQSAIVSFSSDGGSLLAGLQIGETIRLKNFSTLVPDQARCASSCALAWLAVHGFAGSGRLSRRVRWPNPRGDKQRQRTGGGLSEQNRTAL